MDNWDELMDTFVLRLLTSGPRVNGARLFPGRASAEASQWRQHTLPVPPADTHTLAFVWCCASLALASGGLWLHEQRPGLRAVPVCWSTTASA